ncbi:stress response NST1 [Micractinium conductrix]|uniref:Stress response NST1 n=1 Tax=Micractinium conductrix TaxID=554055 RepID=A0A2P6VEI2_9CHLO|nr:stress response NST1 [Micractinium conductrix]|eukprot:PSC72488.1 stress response NST1 [Micractinium conductrix]
MASSATLAAWTGRSSGLSFVSGRPAAHAGPMQPRAAASLSGGGGDAGSRRRAPPPQAVSQRPLRGVHPGSFAARPPAGAPMPPGLGGTPPVALRTLQQQHQQHRDEQQQQQQQQQAAAAVALAELTAVAEPTTSDAELQPHEVQRRAKISAANKGRTPWNKGRKHPPEVIERIRAATQRAMQRPEVRERLAKANERREPHSEAAKNKIRAKLQERADKAREEIQQQAEIVVEQRLGGSDDPELQALADYPMAAAVVKGLIWQMFKKDWADVATAGWDHHPEFRDRTLAKLRKLSKPRSSVVTKKRKVDKVRTALGHMRKLQEARGKLGLAEASVEKLRRAKVAFASDPVRLAAAMAAEDKASKLLIKLRHQVVQLEEALAPLQEHLDAADAAEAEQQEQQEFDRQEEELAGRGQQLWEEQEQHAEGVASSQAGGGGNGFAAAAAAAPVGYANGAAPANEALYAAYGAAPVSAGGGGDAEHAVNGHAAAAAAAASRPGKPWQR